MDEKSYHFHSDKLIFYHFFHYLIIIFEQEGQRYITYYFIEMNTMLMHMYCTENVDMTVCLELN